MSGVMLSTAMVPGDVDADASPIVVASADSNPQFDQYCIGCHGPDGRGVANVGVDLVASAFVASRTEAELVEFLKVGRLPDEAGNRTGRPMPGFSWVAEGELRSVAAFVKSRNAAK